MNGINLTDPITVEQPPPISGDNVIGNLLHNQMILTPVAIDAHGRVGPMTRQNLYGTPPPAIPPRKQFKPNRPNAKAGNYSSSPYRHLHRSRSAMETNSSRQSSTQSLEHKQKFFGLSHYAPSPSITTIKQLSLGIVHAFSTLILNSFKKLVHSQTSPAFDHYDFLLPRDQIVGLLLDNSLDVHRNVK
jgi:hypothetical protein